MADCAQELCPNWSGDGRVCPCAVLDLPCQACDPHFGCHCALSGVHDVHRCHDGYEWRTGGGAE